MKNANPVSRLVSLAFALVALASLTACGQAQESASGPVKTGSDWFEIKVAKTPVQMQLAVTTEEMQHGLMGRKDLKSGEGMLFVYARPQKVSFWMRNTPTALDIGFFTSDGALREVYPLFPFDERPVPSRSEEIQFALEMKQGWFEFADIKPGDKLDLNTLKQALKARGMKLSAFENLGD